MAPLAIKVLSLVVVVVVDVDVDVVVELGLAAAVAVWSLILLAVAAPNKGCSEDAVKVVALVVVLVDALNQRVFEPSLA
jgi:uncharacterized protein YhhL (DUF1145 family)